MIGKRERELKYVYQMTCMCGETTLKPFTRFVIRDVKNYSNFYEPRFFYSAG